MDTKNKKINPVRSSGRKKNLPKKRISSLIPSPPSLSGFSNGVKEFISVVVFVLLAFMAIPYANAQDPLEEIDGTEEWDRESEYQQPSPFYVKPAAPMAKPSRRSGIWASVKPILGFLFGYTAYGLEYSTYEPQVEEEVGIESDLVWPMNFPMAGLEINLSGFSGGWKQWAVALSGATNLTNSIGTFDDSDYISLPEYNLHEKFSYTESSTSGRALIADAGVQIGLGKRAKKSWSMEFDLLFGYRHIFLEADAWGADGWQGLGSQGGPIQFDDSIRVIHYKTHHLLPYFGSGFDAYFAGTFSFRSEFRLLGIISFNHDDHVLRSKKLNGRAYGAGFSVTLKPRWMLIERDGFSLSLGPDMELQYLYGGWGTLEQSYYEDDPGLPGDQTKTPIPKSDFYITSLSFRLMAVAGISF